MKILGACRTEQKTQQITESLSSYLLQAKARYLFKNYVSLLGFYMLLISHFQILIPCFALIFEGFSKV